MSLYPNKIQVDGVPCGLILRGSANGTYLAVFEREMAEFLQIQLRSYQSYKGDDRRPDYEKLVALADYFGVSTDYLLGRSEER